LAFQQGRSLRARAPFQVRSGICLGFPPLLFRGKQSGRKLRVFLAPPRPPLARPRAGPPEKGNPGRLPFRAGPAG